ncbi:MAG TPA: MBL fold metallo-hydrolase [Polyangiales bacterium]|nr:MBL fold metallo-hydrolase [Polyangiales bacterium]
MSIEVQFIGAAQTVTGSRHLVRTPRATLLLDCGLFQGHRAESRRRNLELGLDPSAVDAVVLSHAHIDHSGALPLLCKQGFGGPIYATPATRDLCAVMLQDAALIQAADARYLNRAIERDHVDAEPIEPLYTREDAARAVEQFISISYRRRQQIAQGVWLRFLDAGHVLGSAICVLDIEDGADVKRLVFSGDLGRAGLPILRDPEVPDGATGLILEGTYGDRLHPPLGEVDQQLAAVVQRTAARGGKVIIPSFALERAQQLVFALKKLRNAGQIPKLPVYVDSPLAVNITQVFRLHPECYDSELAQVLASGDSPFEFEGLRFVDSPEESRAIDARAEPCVVISASGMCEAGRVLHHLKACVEDPRHSVVIVGFQAQHTLGRRLVERRPKLRIFGVERRLQAEVAVLNGLSAHADSADLVHFAKAVRDRGALAGTALVHGDPAPLATLRTALEAAGLPEVRVPKPNDTWRL